VRSILIAAVSAIGLLLSASCSGGNEGTTPTADPTSPPADAIDQRIDAILADGGPSFGEFDRAQLRAMMEVEEDAPFYMVNLIKFREFAAYADGSDATLTGREANARYNALPIILEIGGRPVFVAEVEQQLIGDETRWDQVAIVYYPTRAAFVSMLERADFQETSTHKDAGVEESVVLVTTAKDVPALPPPDLATLPFPPTAEDPAFTMVHIMRFQAAVEGDDGTISGRDLIGRYEQAVAVAALPLGIRPTAALEVEGVLVGDGRAWDEVRLNRFPSHAAFRALSDDPSWQAQQADRSAALADTYALITLPIIDSIAAPMP
jgi:uncharacterized protein (DUF1330 family)